MSEAGGVLILERA